MQHRIDALYGIGQHYVHNKPNDFLV